MGEKLITIWFCEYCERSGAVDQAEDNGVIETIRRVEDGHYAQNPSCNGRTTMLRILNDASDDVSRIVSAALSEL